MFLLAFLRSHDPLKLKSRCSDFPLHFTGGERAPERTSPHSKLETGQVSAGSAGHPQLKPLLLQDASRCPVLGPNAWKQSCLQLSEFFKICLHVAADDSTPPNLGSWRCSGSAVFWGSWGRGPTSLRGGVGSPIPFSEHRQHLLRGTRAREGVQLGERRTVSTSGDSEGGPS